MGIFVSFCIFITLLSYLQVLNNSKNKFNELLFYYISIFLIFIAAFRYECGPDYSSYKELFDLMDIHTVLVEPIFFLLILGIKEVSSYEFLLAIVALLSISLKMHFIKKYSFYVFISIIFYFTTFYLNQDFGQIRQGLSIAIFWYGLRFYLKKQYTLFYIVIIICILIHYSSIVYLPFCLFNTKIKSFKTVLLTTILLFILGYIMQDIIKTLSEYIDNPIIRGKIENYASHEKYGVNIGLTPLLFIRLFILYILINNLHKIPVTFEVKNTFIRMYCIGLYIYAFFNFNMIWAIRLSTNYNKISIILLSYLLIIYKMKRIKILITSLILIYCYYRLHSLLYNTEGANLIPYKTIFTRL